VTSCCACSITGSCLIWSILKVILCLMPRLMIPTRPAAPSRTKGMAKMVLRALPWAPRVGLT
jgi:hypothetical protein